jgi:2-polyprenyl-3-methyl-5-hydroxy-6-metoxy-1,4-benzoquinol methylase
MKNSDDQQKGGSRGTLAEFYDSVYSSDGKRHFTKYRHGGTLAEDHHEALRWLRAYEGPRDCVVDFGCGQGDFLRECSSFRRRIGIDSSSVALETAQRIIGDAVDLRQGDESLLDGLTGQADVVTSFGTLEHTANPAACLHSLLECLKPTGTLILSCPSFLNVRGVIWMTLALLLDVPMSLSDRHFISPADIERWASPYRVTMTSVDHDVSQGSYFQQDMRRRLTNALRDAGLKVDGIGRLVDWVELNRDRFAISPLSGATMVYVIEQRAEPAP